MDDPPDLFPDRPAGLAAGSTCIEQPEVSLASIEQGTLIEVGEVGGPLRTATDPQYR
ncbi:MAG: hypothetical protein ACRDTC_05090 [Pseudonocardiaceae bacterium]